MSLSWTFAAAQQFSYLFPDDSLQWIWCQSNRMHFYPTQTIPGLHTSPEQFFPLQCLCSR
jgi:hypothetical protein